MQYLQKICPDFLVCAVPGQLLGQLRDPVGGICQSLGASDQFPLGAPASPDQLRQVGHQVGDLLGGRNDLVVAVVPLEKKSGYFLYRNWT